ncbi:MAG: type II toxin-antitoxin system prevent-host-death family antitoxin [Propionibacteriaceae bacterium]|jgi:prevent-host-death family protein|nr:type II toxin-antitoxin system prevent-host-death family antitoxin [Propionibacteriaceae bacterium]
MPRITTEAVPDGVGLRELRAKLSSYIDRVKDGYSFTLTENGRPVARLLPLTGESNFERLVREGIIELPEDSGPDEAWEPPLALPPEDQQWVSEMIRERRW